jgi:hypothetical protein
MGYHNHAVIQFGQLSIKGLYFICCLRVNKYDAIVERSLLMDSVDSGLSAAIRFLF